MKFRWQRGGLTESMATMVQVEKLADLIAEINRGLADSGVAVTDDDVDVRPYPTGRRPENPEPDDRIGWVDTWVVVTRGWPEYPGKWIPVGFTDGPVTA